MHQLSIPCKSQRLLASFEVLEMSEKAGGTDILRDDKGLNKIALNSLVNLEMAMPGEGRQLGENAGVERVLS